MGLGSFGFVLVHPEKLEKESGQSLFSIMIFLSASDLERGNGRNKAAYTFEILDITTHLAM